jgi:hypothetical protein
VRTEIPQLGTFVKLKRCPLPTLTVTQRSTSSLGIVLVSFPPRLRDTHGRSLIALRPLTPDTKSPFRVFATRAEAGIDEASTARKTMYDVGRMASCDYPNDSGDVKTSKPTSTEHPVKEQKVRHTQPVLEVEAARV